MRKAPHWWLLALPIWLSFAPHAIRPASFTHRLPEGHPAATEVLVAAAADLKFAMDSLVAVFTRANPSITVKVTYGSSGNFFEQISNGAPFDLFFSADIDYPRRLQEQHKALSDVRPYGIGQLVLWSRKLDPAILKMNTLLQASVGKIAIANPAHAPYGRRAEESLRYYQLYDKVKDKLVIGENIAQTAQYAEKGVADVGLIALSLALSPAMQAAGGKYWVVPGSAHQPLQQGYILLSHAEKNTGAAALDKFLGTDKAKHILQDFGFGQPK